MKPTATNDDKGDHLLWHSHS